MGDEVKAAPQERALNDKVVEMTAKLMASTFRSGVQHAAKLIGEAFAELAKEKPFITTEAAAKLAASSADIICDGDEIDKAMLDDAKEAKRQTEMLAIVLRILAPK